MLCALDLRGHDRKLPVDGRQFLEHRHDLVELPALTEHFRDMIRFIALCREAARGKGRRCRFGAAAAKGRNVSSARQVHHQRVVAARPGIIAGQCAAQPPGLDAHDRVRLRIEVRAASERFDGDRIGLDPLGVARKRRLDHESEKARQAERVAESCTVQDAVELLPDFIFMRRVRFGARLIGLCQRSLA